LPFVQAWARTPLWKRAEYLHKVDGLMKDNAQPMADALLNEVPFLLLHFTVPDKHAREGDALLARPSDACNGEVLFVDICCVLQVAKGAKDSLTEVIRSGDLIAYTAEEGVRYLGEVLCHLLISLCQDQHAVTDSDRAAGCHRPFAKPGT